MMCIFFFLLFCCVVVGFFLVRGGGGGAKGDLTRYSKKDCNLILIYFAKNCKILTVK